MIDDQGVWSVKKSTSSPTKVRSRIKYGTKALKQNLNIEPQGKRYEEDPRILLDVKFRVGRAGVCTPEQIPQSRCPVPLKACCQMRIDNG